MSRTFAQFNQSFNSGEYVKYVKRKQSYCKPRYCIPNTNVNSQSNHINIKKELYSTSNPCNSINPKQLYTNLFTKLDLQDVVVVTDLSGNTHPVTIDKTTSPYLIYNIDPSGNLFGNSVCGIHNWENYIRGI